MFANVLIIDKRKETSLQKYEILYLEILTKCDLS